MSLRSQTVFDQRQTVNITQALGKPPKSLCSPAHHKVAILLRLLG